MSPHHKELVAFAISSGLHDSPVRWVVHDVRLEKAEHLDTAECPALRMRQPVGSMTMEPYAPGLAPLSLLSTRRVACKHLPFHGQVQKKKFIPCSTSRRQKVFFPARIKVQAASICKQARAPGVRLQHTGTSSVRPSGAPWP